MPNFQHMPNYRQCIEVSRDFISSDGGQVRRARNSLCQKQSGDEISALRLLFDNF